MNIYISSASEDLSFAQQLANLLPGLLADADVGDVGDVAVYVPQDDTEREARLAESRFVVFLVSPATLQSAGVARDIEQMRGMQAADELKFAITVLLQAVALDDYLAELRSVDATSRPIAEVASEVAYYATWEPRFTGGSIHFGPPRPKPAAPPPPPEETAHRGVPLPPPEREREPPPVVGGVPPAPPPATETPAPPPIAEQAPPAPGGAPPPAPAAPPPQQDAPYAQPAPAPVSPAPSSPPSPPAAGEDQRARGITGVTPPAARTLQFSAYHPNSIATETWNTLLVYTYVAEALADIQADAGTFTELGSAPTVSLGQSARAVERGVELTIEPHMEGVTFSPTSDTFVWRDNWRRSLFRFSGAATLAGREQRGWIDIYAGHMAPIARIDLVFPFREGGSAQLAADPLRGMIVTSNIFDAVFISYSHRDREAFRQACDEYRRFGITIYTDELLEAGANYEIELARMIAEANVFHLLWSRSSASSPECRKEWRSALQREPTERFIKPWFWKQPLPSLPDEFTQHHISFKYEPLKRSLWRPETWF